MLKILVLSAALVLAPLGFVWSEDKDAAGEVKGPEPEETLRLMERLVGQLAEVLCAADKRECPSWEQPVVSEFQVPAPYYAGVADGL